MSETTEFTLPDLPAELSQKTVQNFPLAMVISDPRQRDCPIVYVNKAFTKMTGYTAEAAVGRNCRFLQGYRTREEDRRVIRGAIAAGEECTVDILNYKADQTPFVNRLLVTPLHDDETGEVAFFVGVQTERERYTSYAERAHELDDQLRELQHRVKNHLAMILAMIRLEADEAQDARAFADVLSRRVESLSLLYDEFAHTGGAERSDYVSLGAYLSRIATAVHGLDGRPDVRLNMDMAADTLDLDSGARLGLYLSEVMTNSLQHAFEPGETGEVRVSLRKEGSQGVLTVEDDGHGLPEGAWPRSDSLGGRIVQRLVDRLDSKLTVGTVRDDAERPGTRVELRFSRSRA